MQWMSEATTATFEQEVIERSKQTVVVVDFWAPTCAPCLMLGPILEEAVAARDGGVWLVKVNTMHSRELVLGLKIQSIPAVKAFVDGRIVDEFVGLRDRRTVDAFLDRVLPSPEDRALQRAVVLLAGGDAAQVSEVLEPALDSPHHRDDALLLLAQAHMVRRAYDESLEVLAKIPEESLLANEASALRAKSELLGGAEGTDEAALRQTLQQNPADTDARWRLAGTLAADGREQEALDELLELLQRDRAYRDDGARRAMLAILDGVGTDDDLAREYRRKMQIYL
jgi:putative thioredoxin